MADPVVVVADSAVVVLSAQTENPVVVSQHVPAVTMIGDQIAIDGVATGPHLTGAAGAAAPGVGTYVQSGDPALNTPAAVSPYIWYRTDIDGHVIDILRG